MTLNRADARGNILRLDDNVLASSEFSTRQRTGYDRADAAQRERAIDKQARFPAIALRWQSCELQGKRAF